MKEKLYGFKNKEYIVEKTDNDYIYTKYNSLITINYLNDNYSSNEETVKDKIFNIDEIGKTIFLNKDDYNKDPKELLKNIEYKDYKNNIKERIKSEEEKNEEKIRKIAKMAPQKEMSEEEKNKIINDYAFNSKKELEDEEKFKKISKNILYFARIDTETEYFKKNYRDIFYIAKKEKEEEETEYRHKIKNFNDEKHPEGEIVDWRTKIANLYYDKANLEMQLNEYKYNVMLKRKILFNPIKYINTYITNNKLYDSGEVDEFLLKVLKEKRGLEELTDIIYTIQSNQNKIIRTNTKENFIVQGCAGSGKTMILLHRLSYLKFNELLPDIEDIKIITPNKLFTQFLNNISNELEIKEISQITISNYYNQLNKKYQENYSNVGIIKRNLETTIKDKIKKENDIFNPSKMVSEDNIDAQILEKLYSKETLEKIKKIYDEEITKGFKELSTMTEINKDIQTNYKKLENGITNLINDNSKRYTIIENIKNNIYIDKVNLDNSKKEKEKAISKNIDSNKINKIEKTNLKTKENIKQLEKEKEEKEGKIYKIIQKIIDKKEELNKIIIKKQKGQKKNITSKIMQQNLEKGSIKINKQIDNLEKEKQRIQENVYDIMKNILNKKEIISNNEKEIETIKNNIMNSDKIKKIEIKINKYTEKYEIGKKEIEETKNMIEKTKLKISEITKEYFFTIDLYEKIISKIRKDIKYIDENKDFIRVDILYFLYINYLHFGSLIKADKMICFDEAQDYNIIEYDIINKVNNNPILNLYGDINQSIFAKGIKNWKQLNIHNNYNYYELNENYRNSSKITNYCNEYFSQQSIPMGLDDGTLKTIEENDVRRLIYILNRNDKKFAIIFKDEKTKKMYKEKLKLDSKIRTETVKSVKGIEYNTIIAFDKEMNKVEKYITYTRALENLYIVK